MYWHVELDRTGRLITRLVYAQRRFGGVGWWLHYLLALRGTEISPKTTIGPGLRLRHGAQGVVVHPDTTIGADVTIYPGVTVGRSDVWKPTRPGFAGFAIEDDVVLSIGAVILSDGAEPLIVRRGSVVGANAVLTQSTGPDEIWAGVPARCVGKRDHATRIPGHAA